MYYTCTAAGQKNLQNFTASNRTKINKSGLQCGFIFAIHSTLQTLAAYFRVPANKRETEKERERNATACGVVNTVCYFK